MSIPINKRPHPPSYSMRALRDMEMERKRDEQGRVAGWAVIWTLFIFKMGTVALIWYAANGSSDHRDANGLLIVTTWYWLIIPVIAASGFIGHRIRLRAARKRAAELKQAEFMSRHASTISGTMGGELTDEEKARLRELQQRRENGNGVE